MSSKREFDSFFASAQTSIATLSATPRTVKPLKEGIVSHSRRMFTFVTEKRPDWCNEFKRLVVAAFAMYRLRLSDITTTEMVQLVWLILGEVRLRSHGGELHFFNKDHVAWSIFRGMLPEVVFKEVRDFMNKLEGLFRALSGKVDRTDEALLEALNKVIEKEDGQSQGEKQENAMSRFSDNSLWNAGDRPPLIDVAAAAAGEEAVEEPEDQGEGDEEDAAAPVAAAPPQRINRWYITVAKSIRKITPTLIREATKTSDLIKHFIEWCDTPNPRTRSIIYKDRAVLYDVQGHALKFISNPTVADNIYLYLKSSLCETTKPDSYSDDEGPEIPLADPVFQECQQIVECYLRQTFWSNFKGLQACFAALALAKRGLNVLQAFIFFGAGGVGLSLFTDLIATSLGDELHKFFDPSVFWGFREKRIRFAIRSALRTQGCA